MSETAATILVSSLVTLLVALVPVYLAHLLQLSREIKIENRKRRQEGFSSLLGYKILLPQLYVSRFEAYIFSDYHEDRWRRSGYPSDSLDLREAERWMHKSEDLAIEIAKASQGLFEAVGLIKAVFPASKELETLANGVYRHRVPKVDTRAVSEVNDERLESWKTTAVTQLQERVDEVIRKPIDHLGDLLETQIEQ